MRETWRFMSINEPDRNEIDLVRTSKFRCKFILLQIMQLNLHNEYRIVQFIYKKKTQQAVI